MFGQPKMKIKDQDHCRRKSCRSREKKGKKTMGWGEREESRIKDKPLLREREREKKKKRERERKKREREKETNCCCPSKDQLQTKRGIMRVSWLNGCLGGTLKTEDCGGGGWCGRRDGVLLEMEPRIGI